MPTYEYRCPEGHTFELFQRMTDDPPATCAVCGATPVERLLFAPAIHFRGSGFYATDYGRGKSKKDGKEGGESSSSSEAGSASGEKKSESTGESSSGKSEKSEKSEKSDKGGKKAGDAS